MSIRFSFGMSIPESLGIFFYDLSLSLLVARVGTNNQHLTMAFNNFAIFATRSDGGLNPHARLSLFK